MLEGSGGEVRESCTKEATSQDDRVSSLGAKGGQGKTSRRRDSLAKMGKEGLFGVS